MYQQQIYRTQGVATFYCRFCRPSYLTSTNGLVCMPCGEEMCCMNCIHKLTTLTNQKSENYSRQFVLCPICYRAHVKKPFYDYPIKTKLLQFKNKKDSVSQIPHFKSLMRSVARAFVSEIDKCCDEILNDIVSCFSEARDEIFDLMNNYQNEARTLINDSSNLIGLSEADFDKAVNKMANDQVENISFIRDVLLRVVSMHDKNKCKCSSRICQLLSALEKILKSQAELAIRGCYELSGIKCETRSVSNSSNSHTVTKNGVYLRVTLVLDFDLSKVKMKEEDKS